MTEGKPLTRAQMEAGMRLCEGKDEYLIVVPLWKALWLRARHFKSTKILWGKPVVGR